MDKCGLRKEGWSYGLGIGMAVALIGADPGHIPGIAPFLIRLANSHSKSQ